MTADNPSENATVQQAREHLRDALSEHSDDPRSQQLISEVVRSAEADLQKALTDAGQDPSAGTG